MRRIAGFTRQFDQNAGQFAILKIEIVWPLHPHVVSTKGLQDLCQHNTNHQAKTDGGSGPLLQTPVHRQVEVGAKRRKPFTSPATATCLLVLSHTAVA
ncbi:hypothetical protein D3C76_1266200 [compost metagenome]